MKKENAFISANYNFESHKKNLEKLTKLIDENKFNNEKLKEAFINKDKENKNLYIKNFLKFCSERYFDIINSEFPMVSNVKSVNIISLVPVSK